MVIYHHIFQVSGERRFVASVQRHAVHPILRRPIEGRPLLAMNDRARRKALDSGWW